MADHDLMNGDTTIINGDDTCRICRAEGTPEEPLFHPCKCSGSIKYVHQECLMEWLQHSQKKYCELCKTPFRFTKVYDPEMPSRLPIPIFMTLAVKHMLNFILQMLRLSLVIVVWLFWLPWSVRSVWRFYFWVADGGLFEAGFYKGFTAANLGSYNVSRRTNLTTSALAKAVETMVANATVNGTITNGIIHNKTVTSYRLGSGLANLTSSPQVNQIILDTFEGQIITVLVVFAFILIFLIREWVVQQQPPVNPDANAERIDDLIAAVGRAAAAREAAAEELQAAREAAAAIPADIHRRRLLDSSDSSDTDFDDSPHVEQTLQTATNAPVAEAYRDTAEASSRRVIQPISRRKNSQHAEGEVGQSTQEVPQPFKFNTSSIHGESSSPLRRPQLDREKSAQAAEMRRAMEEQGRLAETGALKRNVEIPTEVQEEDEDEIWTDDTTENPSALAPPSSYALPNSLPSSPLVEYEPDNRTPTAAYNFDLSTSGPSLSWGTYSEYAQNSSTSKGKERAQFSSPRDSSSGSERSSRKRTSDMSWEEIADLESVNDDFLGEDKVPITLDDSSDEDDILAINTARPASAAFPSFVSGETSFADEPVTNEFLAESVAELVAEPVVVEPVADEGIYAPANVPEFVAPVGGAEEAAEPPNIAIQANGDDVAILNEEDIDIEVDDFDGVMELIGMRGPLMALVQNGIFSAVLITATVGIGVWIPYIWGRIVVLVFSHPLVFFVILPYKLTTLVMDLSIDVAILAGSTLINLMDRSGRFTLIPTTWIVPSLQTVTKNLHVANVTARLQSEAQLRITQTAAKLFGQSITLKDLQIKQLHLPRYDNWSIPLDLQGGFQKVLAVLSSSALSMGINSTSLVFKIPISFMSKLPTLDGTNSTTISNTTFISENFASEDLNRTLTESTILALKESSDWSAFDRLMSVAAGYAFFTVAGAIYLHRKRILAMRGFTTRGMERKFVEGLGQAGSVMKVVLIIGIEMFMFPLYCGLLLDFALLPLFEHATVWTRWKFTTEYVFTSLFVHWFIGTCYMFHFALFVSMCRKKIMRDGVLYFIRDPDDPTFHPVKEVLERPVVTQLKKIGFSAVIYGVLVVVFLGGVVWSMYYTFTGLLPIHWSSNEPVLEFPVDLLFYNFFMPIAIKYFRPANILEKMYLWWFKQCAKVLRLSSFMFGERYLEEEGYHVRKSWLSWAFWKKGDVENPALIETVGTEKNASDVKIEDLDVYFVRDGGFVRAPAKDSVRPTKDNLFIAVDENNRRIDGKADPPDSEFGPDNDNLKLVYLPPNFRARIGLVIGLIWAFAAVTGIGLTIGPLVFGRFILGKMLPGNLRMNDLYAFSLGLYAIGAIFFIGMGYRPAKDWVARVVKNLGSFNLAKEMTRKYAFRTLKIIYVVIAFGVILPTLFALVMEFYVIIPIHTYLSTGDAHVIHFIQDWTLGMLYVKMMARMVLLDRESQWARSLRAIVAQGYLDPDVWIATKRFILPGCGALLAALFLPLVAGFLAIQLFYSHAPAEFSHQIYRYSYPAVFMLSVGMVGVYFLKKMFDSWKQGLRDEIYLIGEQLHNHGERRPPPAQPAIAAPLALVDNPAEEVVEIVDSYGSNEEQDDLDDDETMGREETVMEQRLEDVEMF